MTRHERILLAHGGGGKLTRDLIREHFLPSFENPVLSQLRDAALLSVSSLQLALTTDTFVVQPVFFPGGDIGHLAVCGTVNDLAVMGADVLGLSAGFVIEEGFSLRDLDRIIASMQTAAKEAGVSIVTGDTKVVEKGSADGIFINTSGIGLVRPDSLSLDPPQPGDVILVNGTLGDHGIAVLSAREDLPVVTDITSDAAPLNLLLGPLLDEFPGQITFMRDATRGGFVTVLNEVAEDASFGLNIVEAFVPVRESVRAVCEMLGFDPLYVANEGKVVLIVKRESADKILERMKKLPFGENAARVGEVTGEHPGKVVLTTRIGGGRILDMLIGDQLPRIC